MHGRQSTRIRSIIRSQSQCRTAATAAAVKTQRPLGKWGRPDPEPTQENSSLANDAAGPSTRYKPNVAKWAPPPETFRNTEKTRKSTGIADRLGLRDSRPPSGAWRQNSGETKFSSQGYSRGSGGLFLEQRNGRAVENGKKRFERDKPFSKISLSEALGRNAKPTERERANKVEQSMKTDKKENNSQKVISEYYTDNLDNVQSRDRNRKGTRDSYKERGSLVERLRAGEEIEIPRHQRINNERLEAANRAVKRKHKQVKPATVDVHIPTIVSVGNLARLLGVRLETLQKCMNRNGMVEQSSYDYILSSDDASMLVMEFNKNPIVDDEAAFDLYAPHPHPNPETLPRRPPVVTIMGHVDHGKTTLLDTLRSSSVAKGEAGGITQHIGAFSVPVPGLEDLEDVPKTITFLDTPGHAAFSAMRARGAQITDIIVLVVAADDGVMPQTREVIDLIKKDREKVGVVVAINKVDKPGADVGKVQNALWAEGIELESMGGDVPSVEVSGLTGQGLDDLVETISLLADIQDIRAIDDGHAYGYVLESKVVKGHGNTATVLLLQGKLTPASHVVCGTTFAKVRQMMDSHGKTVRAARPGDAVIVSGWKELPAAGDEVIQGKEGDVKRALDNRLRKARLEATLTDADAINTARRGEREKRAEEEAAKASDPSAVNPSSNVKNVGPKELRLVIKGDVSGSIEALSSALEVIGNRDAVTKVIYSGVGEVSESDIAYAQAAGGMVVAFSVNVSRAAELTASQNGVSIYSSNIIYKIIDEVKEQVIKLLPPIIEKPVSGEANVLQLFDIKGKGKSIIKVAGCRVSNGIIEKNKRVRVMRNGEVLHEGTLSTLRVLKDDVMEVKKGLECGINITNFSDLRPGDFLQFFQEIEKPGRL